MLGEDETLRWIRDINPVTHKPASARPIAKLPEEIGTFGTSESGILLERREAGFPVVVSLRAWVKPIDFLELTAHAKLGRVIENPTETRMPADPEIGALKQMEEEFLARMEREAVLVGRETGNGKRFIHVYVSEKPEAIERLRQAWTGAEGSVSVELGADPQWRWMEGMLAAAERADAGSLPGGDSPAPQSGN